MNTPKLEPIGQGGFVPLSQSELQEIERRVGRLPADYRHFAETYGYARFAESATVQLLDVRPQLTEVPLVAFFGGSERGISLLDKLDENQEAFPQGTLPIAKDPFGNLFVLRVNGDDPGSVWYADFSRGVAPAGGEGPHGDWYFDTVLAAKSFEDLLDRIVIKSD